MKISVSLDYTPLLDVGTGEPIILLHGLFGNLSNWNNVASEFSTTHRVIIPRLPLYSSPLSRERLDDLVRYVDAFVEHHRLDNIVLMGNSLGGHIALLYAWQFPANVRKVGSSRVDLQACKLEYSIVSPK